MIGTYMSSTKVPQSKDRSFYNALNAIDESHELYCNRFWTKCVRGNYWLFFADIPFSES